MTTATSTDGDVLLTFGKHSGRPIRDVPEAYLHWIISREFTGQRKLKQTVARYLGVELPARPIRRRPPAAPVKAAPCPVPLPELVDRARTNIGPTIHLSELYTLLLSVCRELQREAGERPFFLDAKTAATAVGFDQPKERWHVWKWLRLASSEGYVELIGVGRKGVPSQWRYLKPLNSGDWD